MDVVGEGVVYSQRGFSYNPSCKVVCIGEGSAAYSAFLGQAAKAVVLGEGLDCGGCCVAVDGCCVVAVDCGGGVAVDGCCDAGVDCCN